MTKQIQLSLFEMNTVSHHSHGLWAHPEDARCRFNELSYWTELAELLEYGTFDSIFFADVLGVYDGFRHGPETAIREALQIPNNDPLLIIPAMAVVAHNLGFASTFSTTYEPPFAFARRMSTLDHLTGGRIAWNIVTSYLPNAARNFGLEDEVDHDRRYDLADEYMEVCYKLWEGSWDDDAVIADRQNRIYADPTKVRYINHIGDRFAVAGPHLSQPSPQRTPVLYQAGSSPRGREFAATHAEAVFIGGSQGSSAVISDVRKRAEAKGRNPRDIKFIANTSVIVGRDDDQVARKVADYREFRSIDAELAKRGAGLDLSRYSRDERVGDLIAKEEPGYQRLIRQYAEDSNITIGDLLDELDEFRGERASGGLWVAGTPTIVADAFERWTDDFDLDGFNIRQFITPGSIRDFIELVVPELRRRGRFRKTYSGNETLRERMFGSGCLRLPDEHPGATFRDPTTFN